LKPVVTNKTPEKESASLAIGGNFAVSASLLPDLLGQFRKTHPKLKLQLRTGDRFLMEHMIMADQIELAVINHPPRNRRLVSEICGTDAIVAFGAPDHPLAKKRKINPTDLEHVAFVTRNPAGHKGAGIKYLEVLRKKGLRPDVFMHCESPDGVKVAVVRNNAIGMLFESGVQDEIRQGRFKAIKLPGDELLVANRYIVYHRTRPLSPVGRSFLLFLRESLGGRKATKARAIRSRRVKSVSEA
jgi:DNA-binding transcriptional LysR family regulator